VSERLATQSGSSGVLSAGDWLGGYEIQERLRSGGMAMMYIARRHGTAGFSRKIALKVIHPHLTFDSRFINMFVDEARICSHISHPNVVHVEEFGNDRGLYFLAMEHIDGCSLNDVLRLVSTQQKPLSVELATRIAMQIAAGMHAAHETQGEDGQSLNIIHRDISPANVLISREGSVKLIDFGIAKSRGRLAATATEGTIKGKLRYMAPEQALCKAVDRRADVYSLGVVFWELLTGKPLFGDAEDEVALLWSRIGGEGIPAPSTVNPAVPPAIDQLVQDMLAKELAERVPSAWAARTRMAEHVPGALAIDVAEVSALVTEVAKLPPSEENGEPSPIYDVSKTPGKGPPSRPSMARIPVGDEVEMTITRMHPIMRLVKEHRNAAIAATAVLVLAIVVMMSRGNEGHAATAPVQTAAIVAPVPAPVAPPAPVPTVVTAPVQAIAVAPTLAPVVAPTPAPTPVPSRHRAPPRAAARPQPAATPVTVPEAPRPTAVGGHTIADRPDEVGGNKQQSKKPIQAGHTSIADDFEE
jgi:serine/threonine-protein kinase